MLRPIGLGTAAIVRFSSLFSGRAAVLLQQAQQTARKNRSVRGWGPIKWLKWPRCNVKFFEIKC